MQITDSSGFNIHYYYSLTDDSELRATYTTQPQGVWGAKGGNSKTNNASRDQSKTEQCDAQSWQNDPLQRKRRKKHPASNVAAELAPQPRHAAKACDNNTQTIPNNMVLSQRLVTCRRGWRPSISNHMDLKAPLKPPLKPPLEAPP